MRGTMFQNMTQLITNLKDNAIGGNDVLTLVIEHTIRDNGFLSAIDVRSYNKVKGCFHNLIEVYILDTNDRSEVSEALESVEKRLKDEFPTANIKMTTNFC